MKYDFLKNKENIAKSVRKDKIYLRIHKRQKVLLNHIAKREEIHVVFIAEKFESIRRIYYDR